MKEKSIETKWNGKHPWHKNIKAGTKMKTFNKTISQKPLYCFDCGLPDSLPHADDCPSK